jgi:hypothetical protein
VRLRGGVIPGARRRGLVAHGGLEVFDLRWIDSIKERVPEGVEQMAVKDLPLGDNASRLLKKWALRPVE